jgi:hypothetical protein
MTVSEADLISVDTSFRADINRRMHFRDDYYTGLSAFVLPKGRMTRTAIRDRQRPI